MADPIPNAGTTTDPAEFRRMLARLFSPGIINGLTLTAGTGLSVTAAAGNAAVGDANGITFLPYPAATSLTGLAPNAVTTVYATYRTTGDLAAYLTTAVPSTPYEVVGTVTTNATAVVSTDTTTVPATTPGRRHQSEYPAAVGRYFTTTGKLDASSFGLAVTGVLDATPGKPVSAPLGVRLGATGTPTARWYSRAHRSTDYPVPSGAWTAVPFDVDQVLRNDYDDIDPAGYPTPPHDGAGSDTVRRRFYAGPSGIYSLHGAATFDLPAGGATAATGQRRARIAQYNSAGTLIWAFGTDSHEAPESGRVQWNATIDMVRGNWVEFQVFQDQGTSLAVVANNFTTPTPSFATMTLLQVL